MELEFGEFVRAVDTAVRDRTPVENFKEPQGPTAAWSTRGRSATVELVPPRNVSVTLGGGANADTTWYPVDGNLVPVVSKRIAGFLSEA